MHRKIFLFGVFILAAAVASQAGGFVLGGTQGSGPGIADKATRFGDVQFPLEGSQEPEPVDSPYSGGCDASLNAARTDFTISCAHNAPAIAAHIHRGAAGANGPVVFFLSPATSFTFVVNEQTLQQQVDDELSVLGINFEEFLDALDAGNLYVNVHTMANPGGEIRGQIPVPTCNLFFATFGNGDGITSDIVLLNSATTGGNVVGQVMFYDETGLPIPIEDVIGGGMTEPSGVSTSLAVELAPLEARTISTSGMGERRSGSVHVTSDDPLAGVIRFTVGGLGLAGVGSSSLESGAIAPVRNAEGVQTGLAVQNPGGSDIEISMSLRQGGVEVANGSAMVMLAPGASVSDLLEEYFPDADLEDFFGSVVITSEGGPFAAIALEFGPAGFTTLPVVPLR